MEHTREQLKKMAADEIEHHAQELMRWGRELYAIPEPGFREERTSAYVRQILASYGVSAEYPLAITGFKARAAGREHARNVAVMAELDSLIVPSHKKADPQTGYCHACGHHAQLTTLLGTALGLVKSGILSELDGDVTFLGVPAEEVIELDYRQSLIRAGKIASASGKQEFIRLGVFDDVDMVLCSHLMGQSPEPASWVGHSWNGVIHKSVRYTGRSAHAGLAPERGINALEAALCGLNGVNALRERFRDEDHVRVHYIISKGGDSPNVVPDDVRLEFGVRAASFEAMNEANDRVNRALRLGGEAVGAEVEIRDFGFYLPARQSRELGEIYLKNAEAVLGEGYVTNAFGVHRGSSTDCGDVASLLPLIHPYFGGAVGVPHGLDFEVVNDYAAYVVPAKLAAMTVIDLLWDHASEATRVKEAYSPDFADKEAYLAYSRRLSE